MIAALEAHVLADDLTVLISRSADGDGDAMHRLLPLVYADLRGMARRELGRGRGHATLQPTALVNDLLLNMLERPELAQVVDRRHFYNLCAQLMRQLLSARMRAHNTQKRGGQWRRQDIDSMPELALEEDTDIEALNESLERLRALHPALAEVVDLRSFGGLSVEEVATLVEVDERTVYRHWAAAKAWLRADLAA